MSNTLNIVQSLKAYCLTLPVDIHIFIGLDNKENFLLYYPANDKPKAAPKFQAGEESEILLLVTQ